MAFVDEVVIRVQSGAGGDGCVSFRREKFIPFGGPNGGNGGRGGNVFLVPTQNKQSLLDFKFQPFFRADRGQHGMGKDMNGHSGDDLFLAVPMGTVVYDPDTNNQLADLTQEGTQYLIVKGGTGGRGNKTFTSSIQRAPRIATPGGPGESKRLRLELRLIADVGLIGLPNAGKSSLLRKLSRAKPKVADYPFTTLDPHLGVVEYKEKQFILADLPGLIEGAAEGAGLGDKFLKHVARNRVLLHLVDASVSVDEICKNLEIISNEIRAHDPNLVERPTFVMFTKSDLLSDADRRHKAMVLGKRGLKGSFISTVSGEGINDCLNDIISHPCWHSEQETMH